MKRSYLIILYFTISCLVFLIMIESCSSARLNKRLVGSPPEPLTDTRTFISDFISLHTLKVLGLLALPILIAILVFPLLMLLGTLAVLFFPIPIISSPVTGIAAAIGRRYNSQDGIDVLMQELFDSSECIERISCEIGRSISSIEIRSIIDQALNDLVPYMKSKWKGTIHGYVKGSNGIGNPNNVCSKYTCNIVNASPAEDWVF